MFQYPNIDNKKDYLVRPVLLVIEQLYVFYNLLFFGFMHEHVPGYNKLLSE